MAATSFTLGGTHIGGIYIANPPAPFALVSPVISGSTAYSGSLTVGTPASFAGPYTSTGQVWQRDGEDTAETSSTYVKSASDAGTDIRLKAYADGPGGSVFAYSSAISIDGPLTVDTSSLPEGQAGSSYSYTIPVSGGTPPYTHAPLSPPSAMSFNTGTAAFSGTPASVGSTVLSGSVTDSVGATVPYSFTLVISTTPIGAISDLSIASHTTTTITLQFTEAANSTSSEYSFDAGSNWYALTAGKQISGLSAGQSGNVVVRGKSNYATGSASNSVSWATDSSGSPTVGLSYTPAYVPAWTDQPTRALLLADLGLTASDVITASDYASVELAGDAANAAQKPLVVGTDNGAYTKATTRARFYLDVPMYGYGTSRPKITGASRLEGWLCQKRNDIKIYGIEFKDFTQVHMYAVGTLPLARPDKSGYNASTTPAPRSPYHSGNDKLNIATASAIDAGFNMQCVGHFNITGSPNISSIKPVRMAMDGGPGGTRVPYNYTASGQTYQLYAPSNPSGTANLLAAMDASAPNLLASTLNSATNASLVTAINANTATSGYAAQLDPWTNKVVVYVVPYWYGTATISGGTTLTLNSTVGGSNPSAGDTVMIQTGSTNTACVIQSGSSSPYTLKGSANANISGTASTAISRPLDWTVTKTGGTVTYDAVGAALDMSYCTFSGCDRVGGGIGDSTAVGPVKFHKNVGRATWAGLSYPVLQWTEMWAANNDFQDCLLSGGSYGTVSGRTAGNAQNRAANQDGSMWWLGANNQCFMYYIQARGGTICHVDNNYFKDIEGNINVDTVNSATILDIRNVWDTSANRRDNHTFNYNYIENVKNVVGAIDCNIFYLKGDSFTCIYNVLDGFGAKRVSGYRPNISAGAECGGFLAKNNGYDFDTAGEWYVGFNYMTGGPNGIPWVKGEDKGGRVTWDNNRWKGWTAQLDDATAGSATGRAATLWTGTVSISGTSGTITTTTGTLAVGMRIVCGSTVGLIKTVSGSNITTVSSMTASGSATADYINTVDGALGRWYSRIGNFSLTSNYFENIADQGQVFILLHSITNSGGSYAGWAIHNNVFQNDNSSAYPQRTGQTDPMYLDNSPSGMGSVSNIVLGRNKNKNAAGTEVGNARFRQGSTYYSDNGNSSFDPYVAVP